MQYVKRSRPTFSNNYFSSPYWLSLSVDNPEGEKKKEPKHEGKIFGGTNPFCS